MAKVALDFSMVALRWTPAPLIGQETQHDLRSPSKRSRAAAALNRFAVTSDRYPVPCGTSIIIPQQVVHRDAAHFEDPDEFKWGPWHGGCSAVLSVCVGLRNAWPRLANSHAEAACDPTTSTAAPHRPLVRIAFASTNHLPPFAGRDIDTASLGKGGKFIPFGAGPRVCQGQFFAETLCQTCIAVILRHLRFVPCDGESFPPPSIAVYNKPCHDVRVRVFPRVRSKNKQCHAEGDQEQQARMQMEHPPAAWRVDMTQQPDDDCFSVSSFQSSSSRRSANDGESKRFRGVVQVQQMADAAEVGL